MATSSPTQRSRSFSRPFPPIILKQGSARASTSTATLSAATAIPGRAFPTSMPSKEGRSPRQFGKHGHAASASRKRLRRDSAQEGSPESVGATAHRPPRVRQRLSSQSSVETIRAVPMAKSSPTAPRGKSTSDEALMEHPTRSTSSIRSAHAPTPSKGLNVSPTGAARGRSLHRVETHSPTEYPILLDDGEKTPVGHETQFPHPSRVPVPISRTSSMVRRVQSVVARRPPLSSANGRSFSPSRAKRDGIPSRYKGPSREFVTQREVAAKQAAIARDTKPRYKLDVASRKKHVELWDEPDDHVHAWAGYIVVTDLEYSDGDFFPLENIDVRCSTHAYEGRFSLESNELPVYTTHFDGDIVSGSGVAALKRDYDPARGIVLHRDWVQNPEKPGQWFIKFWVPIPLALFYNRDTRIFKFTAEACLLDDRNWTRTVTTSNTLFDDVSHLRRERVMERRSITP